MEAVRKQRGHREVKSNMEFLWGGFPSTIHPSDNLCGFVVDHKT